MAEQVMPSDGLPNQLDYTNEDGTPATWLEPLSQRVRREKFALRFGIGLAVALCLWTAQYSNGVLGEAYPVGLVILAVAAGVGINAYSKTTRRRFAMMKAQDTRRARLIRAGKWLLFSVFILAYVTYMMRSAYYTKFENWWYWLCAAIVVFSSAGVYLWKREVVLTPKATEAKIYYDRLARQPSETLGGKADAALARFFAKPATRYPVAVAFLWGAYYYALESTTKNSGLAAVVCVVVAGIFAREISLWILGAGLWVLGIGLAVLIAWAAFVGVAALPVSVAVVVGALIIASALRR